MMVLLGVLVVVLCETDDVSPISQLLSQVILGDFPYSKGFYYYSYLVVIKLYHSSLCILADLVLCYHVGRYNSAAMLSFMPSIRPPASA